MKTSIFACLAIFTVFGATASNEEETHNKVEDKSKLFVSLDADENGSISRTEAEKNAALSALFDKLDTNQDGELSLSEFVAVDEL